MKRSLSLLLVFLLLIACLTGCDSKPVAEAPAEDENQQIVNFAPETTAVTSEQQPVEDAPADAPVIEAATDAPIADDVAMDEPLAQDEPMEESTPEPTEEPVVQPFATATPQPNTQISTYNQVTNTGLGFKFSYPAGWNNIPGRSTVCYVQPMENGTVYPARVAVTMKRLAHKCDDEDAQAELVEYLKLLMTQYDEKTFEVSKELDTSTKFMGKKGLSATYMAYDGSQEIQGYVIASYFEKYLFVYHFLCAYEDYAAFEPAMRRMRDSVQAEQSQE